MSSSESENEPDIIERKEDRNNNDHWRSIEYSYLDVPAHPHSQHERQLLEGVLRSFLPITEFFGMYQFMDVLYPKVVTLFYDLFPNDGAQLYVNDLWNVFIASYTKYPIPFQHMDDFLRQHHLYESFFNAIWEHWTWLLRERLRKATQMLPYELHIMVMQYTQDERTVVAGQPMRHPPRNEFLIPAGIGGIQP
jgi:hypothetical protein